MSYKLGFHQVAVYNGIYFHLTGLLRAKQKHTIKQTIGQEVYERDVFGTTTQDNVLTVSGLLTGSINGSGIEARWDALWSTSNGVKHLYSDGEFTGSYVIRRNGLRFETDPKNEEEILFTVELVEW